VENQQCRISSGKAAVEVEIWCLANQLLTTAVAVCRTEMSGMPLMQSILYI
jgi:hypothetical protein